MDEQLTLESPPSWSSIAFSGSPDSQHSSPTESPPDRDYTCQSPEPYERNAFAMPEIQVGGIVNTRPNDDSNYRCLYQGCLTCFTRKSDLSRHEKTHHNPNATTWQCGCCQNLGGHFKYKRKDKVRDHIRTSHPKQDKSQKSKIGTVEKLSPVECPVKTCCTLLRANSCVKKHINQEHQGYQWEPPYEAPNEDVCGCARSAKSGRPEERYTSETSKQRAVSPVAPLAKRAKISTSESQTSDMVTYYAESYAAPMSRLPYDVLPLSFGSSEQTYNHTVTPTVYQDSWVDFGSSDYYPHDNGASNNLDFGLLHGANMSQAVEYSSPLLDSAPTASETQAVAHQLILNSSRVEFLAMKRTLKRTQGFQSITESLQSKTDDDSCAHINSITYNPVKEIITVTGPEAMIERAKTMLESLSQGASSKCGLKSLLNPSSAEPDISMSREEFNDQINRAGYNDDASRMKNFPIKPKETRKLVILWFNYILPILPEILSPFLGGTYTASLVRRGDVEIRAEPCIQIESHPLAKAEDQIRIRELLTSRCVENGWGDTIDTIEFRFSEGRIRSLKGPKEEEDTSGEQSARSRKLRFNHIRPTRKPEMGASLGLLCSNKVSATLGGYVLIDGCKYIVTSDHLIKKSQEVANRDSGADLETVTSPSRHDLSEVEESVKKTLLGLENEINRMFREQYTNYGDQDIPENEISNPPELDGAMAKREKLQSLLEEVEKPISQFAIGAVHKRSLDEPRKASYPKCLRDVPGLEDHELTHQMDWCLSKASGDTGENRHRYQSNHEAESDDYPEESENANDLGEVCYETCDVESAAAVCYVGQGSCHRDGKVNLPVFTSRNNVRTHEWAIMSPLGKDILYPHVAGDSGAWVIRQNDNRLMGQIHSHDNGMVLFTPSRVLFDDLKEHCGVDVSLPPCAPRPVYHSVVASAQPICSMPRAPVAQNYDFLLSSPVASAHLKELLIGTVRPEDKLLGTSHRELVLSKIKTEQSHVPADSPNYLPSTTSTSIDTQQSSPNATESCRSSRSPSIGGSSNLPVTHKKLQLVFSGTSLVKAKMLYTLTSIISGKFPGDHTIELVTSKLLQNVQLRLRSMSPARFRALRVVNKKQFKNVEVSLKMTAPVEEGN